MFGKFHHLLRKLVLIILIVSAQTVQWALALIPVFLNTPNGATIIFFSWLLDVVASCVTGFVYFNSFIIIIIAVISPSNSLQLNCLYLKPQISLFFPSCVPLPTGGGGRGLEWLCGVNLPARLNPKNPMQIKQHPRFWRLRHISSSIHLLVKTCLPKTLKEKKQNNLPSVNLRFGFQPFPVYLFSFYFSHIFTFVCSQPLLSLCFVLSPAVSGQCLQQGTPQNPSTITTEVCS